MICLLIALWMQTTQPLKPGILYPKLDSTVETVRADRPREGLSIIYYDHRFLFVSAAHPDRRKQEPGLFVHSKTMSRWRQITAVSTAGGRFGSSRPNNAADAKRLAPASVGWDFTMFANVGSIPIPLRTSGSFAFPDVSYDSGTDLYELRHLSSWRVPSAEAVVYVARKDLVEQFVKDQR